MKYPVIPPYYKDDEFAYIKGDILLYNLNNKKDFINIAKGFKKNIDGVFVISRTKSVMIKKEYLFSYLLFNRDESFIKKIKRIFFNDKDILCL